MPTEQRLPYPALQDSMQFSDRLGTYLLKRYQIFGVRQGGMGVVYFVEDTVTHHYYAVKTFLPESSAKLTQFVDEIGVWLRIPPYKHIVQASFVEVVDGQPYLFMEYVEGGVYANLREWIRHLSVSQAMDFAYQACLGLEFAYRTQRVLHLDLKPENILVLRDRMVKVTDFGLSKLMRWGSGSFPRQSAGSLPYMSPEQLRGEVVDERSDIFSLGVMMYEMLTGHLPYPFNTHNLNSAQWREQLDEFYRSIDFYTDRGSEPWRQIDNEAVPDSARMLVYSCLFPYPANRWMNLSTLRENFEFAFSPFIRLDDSNIGSEVDLHQKALSLYKVKRISEALNVFNQVLKKKPQDATLWRDAALALIDAGMQSSAADFIARAKSLDPNIDLSDPKLAHLEAGG